MTYELDLESSPTWNLAPNSTAEEILQNVRCLLMTARGTVFLYRDFGLDTTLIDTPLNVAQSRFTAEVARAIAKYEPRCRLKQITWQKSDAAEGQLSPRVFIEIG